MSDAVKSDGLSRKKFTFLTGQTDQGLLGSDFADRLGVPGDDWSSENRAISEKIMSSLRTDNSVGFPWTPQEQNFIDNNSSDRWLEYLVYRYKFKVYPDQYKVTEFPIYLLIEPTSACNLRCRMCFQVDPTFTRKPYMGNMSLSLFQSVVDEARAGGTKAITIASRGEPTLNKELGAMLAYASGKNFIDLKLNTNATKLSEQMVHDILLSDVNELVFSVDSHEKAIYEDIRVRATFEDVVANIERFQEIRQRDYPDSKLTTRVSGVKVNERQDVEGFQRFWSSRVDHVGITGAEERWDTYNNELQSDLTHSCRYLWERLYVWHDGTVNPCDVDYKSMLSPGKLDENTTIRDIWQGEALTKLRTMHLNGERSALHPCDRCTI